MKGNLDEDITHTGFYKTLFYHLLSLSNKFPNVNKQFEEATSKLGIVRKHYSNTAILNEIIGLCLTFPSSNKRPLSEGETLRIKVLKDLKEAFTLIELQSYIQPASYIENVVTVQMNEDRVSDATPKLFDIERKPLQNRAKEIITEKHMEVLKEEIRDCLLQQYIPIITFTIPDEAFSTTSEGLTAVVSHISNLGRNSNTQRSLVAKQKQYNGGLLKLVFQQLIEYGNAMESLVKKFRFSSQPLPHLGFVSISLKAYLLKLRCLEREVLTFVYSRGSVPVLKRMNEDLGRTQADVTKLLIQAEHKLSTYEGLNPDFYELLREFSNLQKDIKFFRA